MNKRVRPTTLHVSPKFRNLIKAAASLNGKSIVDFTDEISRDEEVISEYLSKKKKKECASFGFKI
jgi:uncharacterized protein (DUF1778 family)